MAERPTVFLIHGRNLAARDQVEILLDSLGFSVLSWSGCRELLSDPNPPTLDIVNAGIDHSDACVILLTADDAAQLDSNLGNEKRRRQPRPNVLFEAGLAMARRPGKTVIVQVGSVDVFSDVTGLNICRLTDEPAQRRDFSKRLRSAGLNPDERGDAWLDPERGGRFSQFLGGDPGEPLGQNGGRDEGAGHVSDPLRGLFTEYLCDSALSIRLSSSSMFRQMREDLRNARAMSLKYHYIGPRLADYWVAVTQDPEYGHEVLAATTSAEVGTIVESAGYRGKEIDFISLGPGDGKLDRTLLHHLRSVCKPVFYYPVDISHDLLEMAVVNVQEGRSSGDLRIKAFRADFEDGLTETEFLMRADDRPALFSLIGFTLGNSDEERLLESIGASMRQDDRLLVDARLHTHGRDIDPTKLPSNDVNALMAPYSSEAVHRFAFGPVEVATDFAVGLRDVSIVKHIIRHGSRHSSAVPGAIVVFLQAIGLYDLKNRRFLESIGFSPDDSLSSKMAAIRRARWKVDLARVTFYDRTALWEWVESRGFQVLWAEAPTTGIGLFLLGPTERL